MADESFNLADAKTDERTVDALNSSFNSISEMCDEFVNYERPQDYALFTYNGAITKGEPIELGFNVNGSVNVWGINLLSYNASYSLLGVAERNEFIPSIEGAYVYICQVFRKVL